MLVDAASCVQWWSLLWFILVGCGTALDTLGAQAVGKRDVSSLVTWDFSALLVLTAMCIPATVRHACTHGVNRWPHAGAAC